MDQLHLMNVFAAVADANGFAGAARKLNISPPMVTRAINELEAHLGVRLLTRTTRMVRVTEAGERYVRDCRIILAELANADESVMGMHSGLRGQLTITAPAWFGALFITPIITEYLELYPQVRASCWFTDRQVNMIEEGVDVAIRIAELPDSSMQGIRVGSMRLVLCASPAYLARHGTPRSIGDLPAHRVVSASGVLPGLELRFAQDGAPRTVKVESRLHVTTNEAAVAAAVSGFGLTQQMFYKVADPLRDGRLEMVLGDLEPSPLPVHVLHREGRHASRKVRTFLDLVAERLRANTALK